MESTTEAQQQAHEANGNSQQTQPLPERPLAESPPVQAVASVPTYASPPGTPAVPNGHDNCPSCGALIVDDQRYCLQCGQRRGDPRLPIMDAVVFMDAMKRPPDSQPPTPAKKQRRISPNAALIAGVGTLLLALGIGVLIGRSGGNSTASAPAAPQVVTVQSSSGGEATKATSSAGASAVGGTESAGKSKKAAKKQARKAADTNQGAEEVLKPPSNVKLPSPTTGVGDKCKKGSAGCHGGQFNGNFFGE